MVILEIPPRYFSWLPASGPVSGSPTVMTSIAAIRVAFPVIDRGALAPEEHGLAPDLHVFHLADKGVPYLFYPGHAGSCRAAGRQEDMVDEHGGRLAVERDSIFLPALAHHPRCLDTGQLLDRLVPCNDRAAPVNGKDRVVERLDGIDKPFPVIGIRCLRRAETEGDAEGDGEGDGAGNGEGLQTLLQRV